MNLWSNVVVTVWTTTQERRGAGSDGRSQGWLCCRRSSTVVHPRRRLPVSRRSGQLSTASQRQRPPVQRVLRLERRAARPVRRHEVLVPTVCTGARRQRPSVVVRRRRGMVETASRLHTRPLGSPRRPHPPLDNTYFQPMTSDVATVHHVQWRTFHYSCALSLLDSLILATFALSH